LLTFIPAAGPGHIVFVAPKSLLKLLPLGRRTLAWLCLMYAFKLAQPFGVLQ
jgi:hypothetical protein